jgi:hypothetical protein
MFVLYVRSRLRSRCSRIAEWFGHKRGKFYDETRLVILYSCISCNFISYHVTREVKTHR